MAHPFAPYQQLKDRAREVALLSSAGATLAWDQETYLPPRGHAWRAEQLSHLAGIEHRRFTAAEVGDWLRACEGRDFPAASVEAANVRGWRRAYDRAVKLPAELVEAFELAKGQAVTAWQQARADARFSAFQPHLEKLMALTRRKAEHWGYRSEPYDALLEEYEPGTRAADLAPVFAELGAAVARLLPRAAASGARREDLNGHYPLERQQAFNRRVAEAIGFDFQAGRIDTTTHPFCTDLGPADTRLTTRYDERDFAVSFFGVLHEAGHGLYDQGLVDDEFHCPAGAPCSLGIHESQSRLWENKVGRSRAFWEHWYPIACDHFPDLSRLPFDRFLRSINGVEPSFIRVEADELTYDLHIVLRFELERRLLRGELSVADLPAAWNERFHALTGLAVPDDAKGCLQDIHWAFGLIGYFPTYTLGNLNSSQIFARIQAALPDWEARFRRGDYASVLDWLRREIHQPGASLLPQDLMLRATGERTQARHHLSYLAERYGA